MRQQFSSGSEWEKKVCYSRAVKSGQFVEVAGTTAVDGNEIKGKGDMFEQACFIFRKIELVLQKAGASLQDVVRTRMLVTDISLWEDAGRAHALFFKDINPVSTLVEVSALVHPDLLIEIEVSAIIAEK